MPLIGRFSWGRNPYCRPIGGGSLMAGRGDRSAWRGEGDEPGRREILRRNVEKACRAVRGGLSGGLRRWREGIAGPDPVRGEVRKLENIVQDVFEGFGADDTQHLGPGEVTCSGPVSLI